jgi:hypothetical protein
LTSELEWDPSVLDHEFKEDESWGDSSIIPSSFDEVGDFKQHVSLKHQSYIARQDGYSHKDVIDQCIFATHTAPSIYEYDNTIYYDACKAEVLDAPTSSQDILTKTTVKRDQISNNDGPFSVGYLLTQSRKHLNILPSMYNVL